MAVVDVADRDLAAIGPEVGALRAVPADELDFARDGSAGGVGDPRATAAASGSSTDSASGTSGPTSTDFVPRPSAETVSVPDASPAVERHLTRWSVRPQETVWPPRTIATSAPTTGRPAVSFTERRTGWSAFPASRSATRRTSKRLAPGMIRRVSR